MLTPLSFPFGEDLPEGSGLIEVAPGIHWARLPLPFALDHVNLYFLEDGDGWTVLDTGIASPKTIGIWEALLDGPLGGRPVTRVIGTHFHPDHVGLVGWLLDRFAPEFWISRTEWLNARMTWLDTSEDFAAQIASFYGRTGLDGQIVDGFRDLGNVYRPLVTPIPAHFQRIGPETVFEIGGRRWEPIFGAGHSPEHVCLFDRDAGIVLGGDFLLPKITPIVAVWWSEPEADPLADYLAFLHTSRDFSADVTVLPAHDRPYKGLDLRIDALVSHHDERLDVTRQAVTTPATARQVMTQLFQRELDLHQTRFAMGESLAHLHRLMQMGDVRRYATGDSPYLYEKAA